MLKGADFEEAIDLWTNFGDPQFCDDVDTGQQSTIAHLWTNFGDPQFCDRKSRKSDAFNKHWRNSPGTLLAYAAQTKCRAIPDKFGKLLDYNGHLSSIADLFCSTLHRTPEKEKKERLGNRIQNQIQCLIFSVQAGCAWQAYLDSREEQRKNRKDEFDAAVLKVIDCYARAYPLTEDCLRENENLWPFVDDDGGEPLRRGVLDAALVGVRAGQEVSVSGYLAAQRLLEYLVGDRAGNHQTGRDQFHTTGIILGEVLSAGPDSPPGHFPVVFGMSLEAVCGLFLDPVAVGLTPVDDDIFKSLRVGWNELSTELSKPQNGLPAARAISICPLFTGPISLSGESAGLVFACGMCAAAHRMQLDPKTTASARLDPENPGKILHVDLESLPAKFKAAKAAGIEFLILEAQQAKQARSIDEAQGLTLIGVSSLAEAWHQMTKRAADQRRMEQVLIAHGNAVAKRWDESLRGIPDDRWGLTHYVEPHYALLPQELNPVYLKRQIGWQMDEANKHREDLFQRQPLDQVLKAGHRLCLMEDAGTGKSVFTRMVEGLASRPAGWQILTAGRPCLAVRWERQWPGQQRGAVLADLVRRVEPYCGEDLRAEDVVKYAIEQGRVVLILDALDQVPDAQRTLASLAEFLESDAGAKCRVILTSRYYEVPNWQEHFFHDPAWRFARIEGFDEQQQHEYLRGLYRNSLDELVPNREEVADLMKIPIVLHMIRESAVPGQPLGFRHRGDLYLRATRRMIERAIEKAPVQGEVFSRDDADRLERMLAAGAFTMMVQQNYEYAIWGKDSVSEFRRQVLARAGDAPTGGLWRMVKTATDLTDRSLLEVCRDELLGFRHRGMMEFYCGLYLAKYASERCVAPLRQFANDQQWNWAWRFAIELPKGVRHVETWCRSLGLLFEQPARGTRPTELMYRSWPSLLQAAGYLKKRTWEDRDLFQATRRAQVSAWGRVAKQRDLADSNPARELVLRFLGEFPKICADHSSAEGEIARQLLPDGYHTRQLWDGEIDELKPGEIPNFIECPAGKYMMGAGDNDGKATSYEKPQHEVELSAFLMQTTAVTVAQYRLFDPQHACNWSDDCPVTDVSWYDAWVFALWIGGLLPTEAQWEYACRAGTDTAYSFGGDAGQLEDYAWYDKNSDRKAYPVATRLANPWGLYDMHGNVWEWCWDWYGEYERTEAENPTGRLGGSLRVFRGGCWDFVASICRSACRDGDDPGVRYGNLGFRLARAVSLCPAR